MNKRVLTFGLLIGLIGGSIMALFAMVAMKALGHGFLTPVNLFAHTFWKDAPLDGTFSLAALGLGVAIHLVISILLGTVIAFLVERGSLDGGAIFLLAIGAGGTAWMLQAIAWTALDTQAHSAFTPWVLAVAHLVFAVGTATVLTRLEHRGVTDTAPSPLTGAADVAIVAPVSVPRATRSGFSRRIGEGVGDADALEA